MSGDRLTAALRYATLDEYYVVPCNRATKRPMYEPGVLEHGVSDASRDPDVIRAWWARWPNANIGIALGASGLAAIDVDNPSAAEAFKALNLPDTQTVTTGRDDGGTHHYYRLPPGVELASFYPAPGLEVRSSGYYVIAPPSVHQTGRVYTTNGTDMQTLDAGTLAHLQALARPAGKAPPIPDKIPAGTRHIELIRMAGHLRRAGFLEAEILAALRQANRDRCEPPVADDDEGIANIARDIGKKPAGEAQPGPEEARTPTPTVRVATLGEFIAVDEEGAEPLLGDGDGALIPEDGTVMAYGDGGAGKTTLAIDLGFHMAAGDPWLGVAMQRQTRVLIVENEGPRPLFRLKLRRKVEAWRGSPIGDRISVLEDPWAKVRFDEDAGQDALATTIREREIDVVIIGPVTAAGMLEAGTIQQVREFEALIQKVRKLAGRRVTFILIHHENKSGSVSGSWEGVGETLFHVSGQEHGKTRVYIQKARWSSKHHATTMQLVWTDGDGFALADKPEFDAAEIAEQILTFVAGHPGTGWTRVEEATPGVARDTRRDIRDMLLRDGSLVNIGKDEDGAPALLDHVVEAKPAHLYLPDDPTIRHLRRGSGAVAAQSAPPTPVGEKLQLRPAPRPIEAQGVGAADTGGQHDPQADLYAGDLEAES